MQGHNPDGNWRVCHSVSRKLPFISGQCYEIFEEKLQSLDLMKFLSVGTLI
jgi:hypothetical protein